MTEQAVPLHDQKVILKFEISPLGRERKRNPWEQREVCWDPRHCPLEGPPREVSGRNRSEWECDRLLPGLSATGSTTLVTWKRQRRGERNILTPFVQIRVIPSERQLTTRYYTSACKALPSRVTYPTGNRWWQGAQAFDFVPNVNMPLTSICKVTLSLLDCLVYQVMLFFFPITPIKNSVAPPISSQGQKPLH